MADVRAQFGVLGPVQLSIDGVAQPVGGPKQRAVLAYLLIDVARRSTSVTSNSCSP